jgi:hypothetical protein
MVACASIPNPETQNAQYMAHSMAQDLEDGPLRQNSQYGMAERFSSVRQDPWHEEQVEKWRVEIGREEAGRRNTSKYYQKVMRPLQGQDEENKEHWKSVCRCGIPTVSPGNVGNAKLSSAEERVRAQIWVNILQTELTLKT